MDALLDTRPVAASSPADAFLDALEADFARLKAGYSAQPYPSLAQRRAWLDVLEGLLKSQAEAIADAIDADFGGRSRNETRLAELFPSLEAVRHARRHLRRWMRPSRRSVSIWFAPGRARVQYQPLGVVGVIVPWNYPLYLAVGPLVGALAAGNRVMIKLSEYTPAFGALFARLIAQAFPADLVSVSNGGPEVASAFSRLPFDHLLFTGSTSVGRHVMRAAADNLTPVTLELGGKSPTVVAPGFDIATAARRIAFGKMMNAGQTCVAPDYVLVPQGQETAFLDEMRRVVRGFYGDGRGPDYTSVVNGRHYARLTGLLDDARERGARLEPLLDTAELPGHKLTPTLVLGVDDGMKIMQEEIFGPVLPVMAYRELDEAIAYINAHDRPLALYLFDNDTVRREALLRRTHSGGVTINDCMLHVAQDNLPFGGVGPSGMGHYHAEEGFRTFSKARGIFTQSRLNALSIFHPPHGKLAAFVLKLMLR